MKRTASGMLKMMVSSRMRAAGLIALGVLALDWSTKAAVRILSPDAVVPHFTAPNPLVLPFAVLAGIAIVRLIDHPLVAVALGIAVGGVAGNLLQRVIGAPITDFISLPALPWAPAAVWNLADLAIWSSIPLFAIAAIRHFFALRRKARCENAALIRSLSSHKVVGLRHIEGRGSR